MTIDEAAALAGRSVKTVRRRLEDGTLTGRKDRRGRWDVDEASVLRWTHPDQALTTIDPAQLDNLDTLGQAVSTLRADVLNELWSLRAEVEALRREVAVLQAPRPWWQVWRRG